MVATSFIGLYRARDYPKKDKINALIGDFLKRNGNKKATEKAPSCMTLL